MKKYKYRVKPWMLPVGLTLIFVLILRFVLLVGYVPTPSMEPTLRQNSIIVGTRLFGELKTGDIIVFQKDGVLVVKRIAGCPGERIDLTKISYMESVPIPIFEQEVITVPENAYFVLGDNSQNSWDSRYWEDPLISAEEIVAKVIKFY
jgi:signal peptidase I